MSGPPAPPDSSRSSDDQQLLLGTAVAGVLIGFGLRRRGIVGTLAGIAGAGVLATLVAPRLAPRVSTRVRGRRAIDVTTEFVVDKPRAAVFAFFRNFENFPLVGGFIESIDDFDDGRSHWRVLHRGSAIEWDVIVTKYVPPRVIAWESVPGSPVESAGTVRFDAIDDATTCVRLSLSYRPVSPDAARAFVTALRRPERRISSALGRIDAAMERALEPDVHHRAPAFPLPEAPVTEMTLPSATADDAAPQS